MARLLLLCAMLAACQMSPRSGATHAAARPEGRGDAPTLEVGASEDVDDPIVECGRIVFGAEVIVGSATAIDDIPRELQPAVRLPAGRVAEGKVEQSSVDGAAVIDLKAECRSKWRSSLSCSRTQAMDVAVRSRVSMHCDADGSIVSASTSPRWETSFVVPEDRRISLWLNVDVDRGLFPADSCIVIVGDNSSPSSPWTSIMVGRRAFPAGLHRVAVSCTPPTPVRCDPNVGLTGNDEIIIAVDAIEEGCDEPDQGRR